MYLADLTWEEVNYYLREKDSLIIPAGICEQHSKHLPLNTDTIVAEYISKNLSQKTGILIAPNSPGCQGYPSFASKEKGKKIVELIKENALNWINKYI